MLTHSHKVAAVCLALSSFAVQADEWTGPDKTKHFTAGALIAASTLAVASNHTAFLVGTGVGLAKEVADYRSRARGGEHDSSVKDFAVTALGSAVGAYVPGLVLGRKSISYSWSF